MKYFLLPFVLGLSTCNHDALSESPLDGILTCCILFILFYAALPKKKKKVDKTRGKLQNDEREIFR